jgi:hypothetical protein
MGLSQVAIFAGVLATLPVAILYALLPLGSGDVGPLTWLFKHFGLGQVSQTTAAGIGAVFCVNVVLAAFVIAAWAEPSAVASGRDRKKNE